MFRWYAHCIVQRRYPSVSGVKRGSSSRRPPWTQQLTLCLYPSHSISSSSPFPCRYFLSSLTLFRKSRSRPQSLWLTMHVRRYMPVTSSSTWSLVERFVKNCSLYVDASTAELLLSQASSGLVNNWKVGSKVHRVNQFLTGILCAAILAAVVNWCIIVRRHRMHHRMYPQIAYVKIQKKCSEIINSLDLTSYFYHFFSFPQHSCFYSKRIAFYVLMCRFWRQIVAKIGNYSLQCGQGLRSAVNSPCGSGLGGTPPPNGFCCVLVWKESFVGPIHIIYTPCLKKTVPTYFLLLVCQIWTDFNKNWKDCPGRNP